MQFVGVAWSCEQEHEFGMEARRLHLGLLSVKKVAPAQFLINTWKLGTRMYFSGSTYKTDRMS